MKQFQIPYWPYSDATYGNRWSVFEIVGAESFRSAHTANALTAGLPATQVAIQTGINNTPTTGDMAVWEDIAPGNDGTFDVTSCQYTGSIPGGGTASGSKAYALTGIRLEQLVFSPVSITAQPANQSILEGETVNLSVQVGGYPRQFQWYKDDVAITGATNSTFSIAPAALADSGRYYTIISNSLNSVTSSVAQVSVYADRSVTIMPITNTVWAYEMSGFDQGTAWSVDEYDASGWGTGQGLFGSEDNPALAPLISTPLDLVNQFGERVICYYFRTHFLLTNDPASYYLTFLNRIDDGAVFYLNGTEIQRVRMPMGPLRNSTLATNAPPTGDAVDWNVFHIGGARLSNLARLTNLLAVEVHQQASNSSDIVFGSSIKIQPMGYGRLAVLEQPQSGFGRPGERVTLDIGVTGLGPITYKWFKNNLEITGQTNSTLVLSNFQVSDSAWYRAVASNEFGTVSSASALLTPCEWQQVFGGSGKDQLFCVQETADGGLVLGGYSASGADGNKTSPNFGSNDFWLIRLDAHSNKLWEKTFGGSDDDQLRNLEQTPDGGFILGGISKSPPSGNKTSLNYGNTDFWVIRVDSEGKKLWERTYGGGAEDTLHLVRQTYDGNILLAGRSYSSVDGTKTAPFYGSSDFWLVLIDQEGNQLWDKTHGASGFDANDSITLTLDGGYLVGGTLDSYLGGDRTSSYYGDRDWGVYRLDGKGDKIWDTAFGGASGEGLFGIEPTTNGGFVLGGDSWSAMNGTKTSPNYGARDFWVNCIDGNGQKLWERTFGGAGEDAAWGLKSMPAGGYVMGGQSASGIGGNKSSPGFGSNDFWVVRFDDNGNRLWDVTFGGPDNDVMRTLCVTHDGGVVLGGYSSSPVDASKSQPSYGNEDFWIIKIPNPEPSQAPRIVLQPRAQTLSSGGPLVLSITARGNPLSYQWFRNNVPIPGATKPIFSVAAPSASNCGYYWVSVSNALGGVTSESVAVMAGPPPKLQVSWWEGDGGVRCKFYTGGLNWSVWTSSNLTNWTTLTNVTGVNGNAIVFDPASPLLPQRFYRLRLENY